MNDRTELIDTFGDDCLGELLAALDGKREGM